jgi:type IV fimbrial biogenesis protein FimT
VCSGGAEPLRLVRVGGELGISLQFNSRSMLFDPVKGTTTPTATFKVTGRSGSAIHQVVNIMGRVRSCSPTPALSGYKAC